MATLWSIIVNRMDGASTVWKEWRAKVVTTSPGPGDPNPIVLPMLVNSTGKLDPSVIPGGGGNVHIKQTEIDFGPVPVAEALFTIVDADVDPSSNLQGEVAYVAPTGKDLDETEMDGLELKFGPGSGQFFLYARGRDGYIADKFKVNYLIG